MDHGPEIGTGRIQRRLGTDEAPLVCRGFDIVRVDVVAILAPEDDPRRVETLHILVAVLALGVVLQERLVPLHEAGGTRLGLELLLETGHALADRLHHKAVDDPLLLIHVGQPEGRLFQLHLQRPALLVGRLPLGSRPVLPLLGIRPLLPPLGPILPAPVPRNNR